MAEKIKIIGGPHDGETVDVTAIAGDRIRLPVRDLHEVLDPNISPSPIDGDWPTAGYKLYEFTNYRTGGFIRFLAPEEWDSADALEYLVLSHRTPNGLPGWGPK